MEKYHLKINSAVRKNMIKVYIGEILSLILSGVGCYLLFRSLEMGNIGIPKYILIALCINLALESVVGIIQNIGKLHYSFSIIVSILTYIILTIILLAFGYRPSNVGSIILAVILSAIVELIVILLFCLPYISSWCSAEVKMIAYRNDYIRDEFSDTIDNYNSFVSKYNAVASDIINTNKRLGLKKTAIKVIDEYYDRFDLPELDINSIGILQPTYFLLQANKYESNSDSYKNKVEKKTAEMNTQIEYIKQQMSKTGDLYNEVKRLMGKVDDRELPASLRESFESVAKPFVRTLGKRNRKIKKVR